MLILGEGTKVKTLEGLQWLERAANQDHSEAIRLLFDLRSTGYRGVPISASEANRWRQAAFRVDPGTVHLRFSITEQDLTGPIVQLDTFVNQLQSATNDLNSTVCGPFLIDQVYSITLKCADPDACWTRVKPILKLFPTLYERCRVTNRYGPYIEGVREESFEAAI